MITDRHDKRSNRCAKCNHTYTSRWHKSHCGVKSHKSTGARRSTASRTAGYRRSMSEILASSFSWDSATDQQVTQ